MKNFVISHFGLFEVDTYPNLDSRNPVTLCGGQLYPELDNKLKGLVQAKGESPSFLTLLFRIFFKS